MSQTTLVWVLGSGGLLGRSVWRELGADAWRPDRAFTWNDAARIQGEFQSAVNEFAERVVSEAKATWAIAWCAGAGVVATSAADLAAEIRAFELFLSVVGSDARLAARPGYFAHASSAGGVYGGCSVSPIDESTSPTPISAYGHAKLEQERILSAWRARQPNVRVHVARFSNLYGTSQQLNKAQGLISHAARCLIHGAPLQIYVSLDTIRDYLYADDAGRDLVHGLRRIIAEAATIEPVTMKIYASEREISIAGLLGVFRQVARRRLRTVAGLHPSAAMQPRRLQFRSQLWTGNQAPHLQLVEGVSRVLHHQMALFGRGLLPPPNADATRRARPRAR
jgi:UDP-glucose 4-epimerase